MSKAEKCGQCPQFEWQEKCGLFEKLTSHDSGCIHPTHADKLKARELIDTVQWWVWSLLAWKRTAEEYLSRVS